MSKKKKQLKAIPAAKSAYDGIGVYPYFFDVGTVGRNQDLLPTKTGAATAFRSVPPVNRAVNLRASAVGSLKWRIKRRTENPDDEDETIADSDEAMPNHPLGRALRKARRHHRESVFSLLVYGHDLYGENYFEPLWNEIAQAYTGIRWLNPLGMTVQVVGGKIQRFQWSSPGSNMGSEYFTPYEVCYDHTFDPLNDYFGWGLCGTAMREINISRNLKRFIEAFYRNNARPSFTFSPKDGGGFNDQQNEMVQRNLTRFNKGADNGHTGLVIPFPADLHTFEQEDIGKQYSINKDLLHEIYTVFGVPLAMAGDDSGTQYKTGDDVLTAFYQNTIGPLARRFARFINDEVLMYFDDSDDVYFEFDTSEFDAVSSDDQLRSSVAVANYQGGIWTQNEARGYTQKKPTPTGDIYITELAPPELPMITPVETPRREPLQLPAQTITQEPAENAPEAPQKAVQDTPEAELAAWLKVALKSHKRAFEPIHLRGDFGDWLSEAVVATEGNTEAVKMVFAEAKTRMEIMQTDDSALMQALYSGVQMVSIKAYSDTKEAFVSELLKLFQAAVDDETNRRNFAARMRTALNRYGLLALRDGLNEAGADPEALPEEALKLFKQWRVDQSRFVTNLGNEVFKGAGITENEVSIRANMWADISLNEARLIGIQSANAETLMEWVLGNPEQHCDDCPRLAGTVMSIKEWRESGVLPGSGKTECKQGCKCGLRLTNKKRSGNIRWLVN